MFFIVQFLLVYVDIPLSSTPNRHSLFLSFTLLRRSFRSLPGTLQGSWELIPNPHHITTLFDSAIERQSVLFTVEVTVRSQEGVRTVVAADKMLTFTVNARKREKDKQAGRQIER